MADDDPEDEGGPSPDEEGEMATGHGYDAVFFIVAIITAICFVIALYYFRG